MAYRTAKKYAMIVGMTEYDTSRLAKLGARRAKLRAEMTRISKEIAEEVPPAHAAGVKQADLARLTGMSRESIAQLCLPPEERWKRDRTKSKA